jgi:hypothetical protein
VTATPTLPALLDAAGVVTVTATARNTGEALVQGVTATIAAPPGFTLVSGPTPPAPTQIAGGEVSPPTTWTFRAGEGAGRGVFTVTTAGTDANSGAPVSVAGASGVVALGRRLAVTAIGSGTLSCNSTPCSPNAAYPHGTTVTVTQVAAAGFDFATWGGACSGAGACQVVMDAERTVTATFSPQPTLAVIVAGAGAVQCSANGGPSGACAATYPRGTRVTITATAEESSVIANWTGPCAGIGTGAQAGTGSCLLTLDAPTSTGVQFAVRTFPVTTRTLSGSGDALIECSLNGGATWVVCNGEAALGVIPFGSAVRLTPRPVPPNTFDRWGPPGGACAVSISPCVISPLRSEVTVNVFFSVPGVTDPAAQGVP